MDAESRQAIVRQFAPRAVLKALTDDAAYAVPSGMLVANMIAILRFPFRVGRESRVSVVDGQTRRIERPRRGSQEPNNDLYLVDAGNPLQISREHFKIEAGAAGYLLVDRGSACGTGIGAIRVGGRDRTASMPLKDGDTIAVGDGPTPYRYQFIALE